MQGNILNNIVIFSKNQTHQLMLTGMNFGAYHYILHYGSEPSTFAFATSLSFRSCSITLFLQRNNEMGGLFHSAEPQNNKLRCFL